MVSWYFRIALSLLDMVMGSVRMLLDHFFGNDQYVYLKSPYNGFGGYFNDAFMHNLELFPWLLSIIFMVGVAVVPFSTRKDLDYFTLVFGLVKAVVIVALGRVAIHLATQVANAVMAHLIIFEISPMLLYSTLLETDYWAAAGTWPVLGLAFIIAFFALFGVVSAVVLVAAAQFSLYATYVLLPILAPLLVFDMGPLKYFSKGAKLQIGLTFFLIFVVILFVGYLQVGVAAIGGFAIAESGMSAGDFMTASDSEMRAVIGSMDTRSRLTASFVAVMGLAMPFFLSKRFMGQAVSAGGGRGLRGARNKSSSGSSKPSGDNARSQMMSNSGSAGKGGSTGGRVASTSASSGTSSAASGTATAGTGSATGGSIGSLGGGVGALVGAAAGKGMDAVKSRVTGSEGGMAEAASDVGETIGRGAGGAAVKTGQGVRHMMENPHGNPALYGASGLQHAMNRAPSFSQPEEKGWEFTYRDSETEVPDSSPVDQVGVMEMHDESNTRLPYQSTIEDHAPQLEDGETYRMTELELGQTNSSSEFAHTQSDSNLVPREENQNYTTYSPTLDTETLRVSGDGQ